MEKITIIKRYQKSITDFKFSNHFLKETTGKAIGFMMIGYLIFVIVLGLAFTISVRPDIKKFEEETVQVINSMPEFSITEGKFRVEEDARYKQYNINDLQLILDLDQVNDVLYYNELYHDYILIREDAVYVNGSEMLAFNIFDKVITQSDVEKMPRVISSFMMFAMGVAALVGILGVFIISLLMWGLVIIINGFMKKEISSVACYKIAIYSMTIPGILVLFSWSFAIAIPSLTLLYVVITGIYAYGYLSQYTGDVLDLNQIYE